jgi:hypothetical protein
MSDVLKRIEPADFRIKGGPYAGSKSLQKMLLFGQPQSCQARTGFNRLYLLTKIFESEMKISILLVLPPAARFRSVKGASLTRAGIIGSISKEIRNAVNQPECETPIWHIQRKSII